MLIKAKVTDVDSLSLCVASPVVDDLDSDSVTLTEGDDFELSCTGWGWPVPHVIWTTSL